MIQQHIGAGVKTFCLPPGLSPEEYCPQFELLRGRDGRDGRDGEKGEKGEARFSGEQGPVGPPGPTGPRGPIGISGPRGLIGEKGERGDSGLQGPRGSQGIPGIPGIPGGGAVYIRWGRTVCPTGDNAELLYSGRAGGNRRDRSGGAANILCMPDNPDHLQHISGTQSYSNVAGIDYYFNTHSTLQSKNYQNVPCAVCYVPRSVLLMIPAKTQCPTNWTREYYGYLTSENQGENTRTTYECVDKDPEGVSGENGRNTPGVEMGLVEPLCNSFSCPPYNAEKELTCVVCTR